MRFLLANLLRPELDWSVQNIQQVITDIYGSPPDEAVETHPRIIKSHEQYTPDYKKIIYIYRDGRDVSVSYNDYMVKLRDYEEDFPSFLQDMLSGKFEYGSWQDHIAGWLWKKEKQEVHSICYERLFSDTKREMIRLGVFLKLKWSDNDIEQAIYRSSFDSFQKGIFSYKHSTHWEKGFRGGVKGGPGAREEIYTPQLDDIFWERAGSVAAKLGYERDL